MEDFTYIRCFCQNIQSILSSAPLASEAYRQSRNDRIVLATSQGLFVTGSTSIIIALATSDQSDARFGPNIDDNKIWMLGFGSTAMMVGTVGMITSSIYARIKLNKAVELFNQ